MFKWLASPQARLCLSGVMFFAFVVNAVTGSWWVLYDAVFMVWLYHRGMGQLKIKEVEAFVAGVKTLNHLAELEREGKTEEAKELHDRIVNVMQAMK